jgi:glycosyltransferase involved in cell wall biosynthesis
VAPAQRASERPSAVEPGQKLSAIIITRNEAANLPDCLASLAFCDEVIVVDNASTDATAAIAAEVGARVVLKPEFAGFGLQKQAALEQASGDWVLSIDADERVPDALAREIRSAIAGGVHAGFRINRRTFFLGRYLRHGGWYPDRVLRLARRAAARFTADAVHERLEVSGSVGNLDTDMLHMSYRSIDDVLAKQRRYALLSAQARRARGAPGGLAAALARSVVAFFKHYLLQLGLLDGSRGLVASLARAQETFWRYLAVGWEKK